MSRAEELRKIALLPLAGNFRQVPHGFASLETTTEQAKHLNEMAVETFMDMANAGAPFADCLGAVLLTGMHFATESLKKSNAELTGPASRSPG